MGGHMGGLGGIVQYSGADQMQQIKNQLSQMQMQNQQTLGQSGRGLSQWFPDPVQDTRLHETFGLSRTAVPTRLDLNKKEPKMGFIKEYFTKHKELFMGLAVAIILDKYLLGGAFQERLKRIITGLLDKTEATLAHKPDA